MFKNHIKINCMPFQHKNDRRIAKVHIGKIEGTSLPKIIIMIYYHIASGGLPELNVENYLV